MGWLRRRFGRRARANNEAAPKPPKPKRVSPERALTEARVVEQEVERKINKLLASKEQIHGSEVHVRSEAVFFKAHLLEAAEELLKAVQQIQKQMVRALTPKELESALQEIDGRLVNSLMDINKELDRVGESTISLAELNQYLVWKVFGK